MKMNGKRYFFRTVKKEGHSDIPDNQEYSIQIPSSKDIQQMRGMPAGGKEDQYQRLTHIVRKIEQIKFLHPELPVMTTDQVVLPAPWECLFTAMRQKDERTAQGCLSKISVHDTILHALLTNHSFEYLQCLVSDCIRAAKFNGMLGLDSDIVITPGTLEVLVKDIATTLFSRRKIHFSFGLPGHHAFNARGSGFCILDKTAILIKHTANTSQSALRFIIIGTDINRDNGLCSNLIATASHLSLCHIDIFDSRVYPGQDHRFIQRELQQDGKNIGPNILCWERGKTQYFAVDLRFTSRTGIELHPALAFALEQVAEQISNAQKSDQKVMLFLPTGWDSHEEETAFCGKYINGRMMSKAEAQQQRFNDADLTTFYEKIVGLYQNNKQVIAGVYWGLEGGYNRFMYEKQVTSLMNFVLRQLAQQDINSIQVKPSC